VGTPLAAEHREDHRVGPLALAPEVAAEVRLLPHADPRREARGRVVARVHLRDGPVDVVPLEGELQDGGDRLGRVPVSSVDRVERPALARWPIERQIRRAGLLLWSTGSAAVPTVG